MSNQKNLLQISQKKKQYNYGEKIVHNKYKILHKIFDEPSSQVYTILMTKSQKQIVRAFKIESDNVSFKQISTQVSVLKAVFANNMYQIGFPRIFQYGKNKQNESYMVTKLLGPNLAMLHKLCGNRFTIQCCISVGLQIVDRIQKLHELNYVYRDFRMENFAIGLSNESQYIHILDFGYCMRYRNKETQKHVPYKDGNLILDDTIFCSINYHNKVNWSRRDDIQALLYMVIYMHKGRLPWKKVQAKTKKEKDQKIGDIKKAATPTHLCQDFGLQMQDLIWYIRSLTYYQKPDYDFVRQQFYKILQSKSPEQKIQLKYDWNDRQELDFQIYTGDPKIAYVKNKVHANKQHQQSLQDDIQIDSQNRQQQQCAQLI